MDIFKDKTTMPEAREQRPVHVTMAPDETRDATSRIINRAVEQEASVRNVTRPRFGHGY